MYEEVIRRFKSTPGDISVTEAFGIILTLIECGIRDDSGIFVDIGSRSGKSSIPSALIFSAMRNEGHFFLVDPLYSQPGASVNQHEVASALRPFLGSAKIQLHMAGAVSFDFLREYEGPPIDYVFLSCAFRSLELLRMEIHFLDRLLRPGGLVFLHGYGARQAPIIVHKEMQLSGKYENVLVDWNKAKDFCREFGGEEGNIICPLSSDLFPSHLAVLRRI